MKKKIETYLSLAISILGMIGLGFLGGVIYEQETALDYWEYSMEPIILYYYNDTLIPEQLFDTVTYHQKWNRSIRIYKEAVWPHELLEMEDEFYTDEFMDEFIYNRTHDETWTKIF